MSSTFFWMLSSVVAVSLISLAGIFFLKLCRQDRPATINLLVALAIGALFGGSFVHLLPEAYRNPSETIRASLLVMAGILGFLALENFLHWHHDHSQQPKTVEPYGYLNLTADLVHNLIDGLLIGASYHVSVKMGFAATLAVMLHEIPQEIGDFGILVKSGFSKGQALRLNFLSALSAVAGGLIAWWVGAEVLVFNEILIPLTAGGFIYIAGSDLVPLINRGADFKRAVKQIFAIAVGAGLMVALRYIE